MLHFNQNRTPILYRSRTLTDGPLGERTILCFYPEGEWDGWRRREETCEAAYPHSEYLWINIDQVLSASQIKNKDIGSLLKLFKDSQEEDVS